jgi:trk system potassium uptake protein
VYIVIAGCRKVGSNLAIALSQENHEVVVIDSDPESFSLLGSGFNGLTVTGMPIDEDVMRMAGIERADALAAVSNDDNMNVMIAQVSSKIFHVPRVIARVYDPEREPVYNRMGIRTICPTRLAVEKIKSDLLTDNNTQYLWFNGTKIAIACEKAGKNGNGGKTRLPDSGPVLGVIRNGNFTLNSPEFQIEAEDIIVSASYAE